MTWPASSLVPSRPGWYWLHTGPPDGGAWQVAQVVAGRYQLVGEPTSAALENLPAGWSWGPEVWGVPDAPPLTTSSRSGDLRGRLTPEFLRTLREAILVVGWARDTDELAAFERDVHQLLGQAPPPQQEVYAPEVDDAPAAPSPAAREAGFYTTADPPEFLFGAPWSTFAPGPCLPRAGDVLNARGRTWLVERVCHDLDRGTGYGVLFFLRDLTPSRGSA